MTRVFFFQLNPCGNSSCVTSSLTRIWVCLLWIRLAFRQVYVSHIYHVTENSSFCTIYKSFVSTGFAEQIMSILRILCYNGNWSSQSQSHIATDGRSVSQSVSQSWCRAPSEAHDQIFITVWQLQSSYCGVPSLTRGRACILSESLSAVSKKNAIPVTGREGP
jgi:hypothetical protein